MSTFPGAFVPVAPPADGLRLAFVAARRRHDRDHLRQGRIRRATIVITRLRPLLPRIRWCPMTIRILSSKAPAPLLARLVTELGAEPAAQGGADDVVADAAGGVDVEQQVASGAGVDVVVLASGAIERLAAQGHVLPEPQELVLATEAVVAVADGSGRMAGADGADPPRGRPTEWSSARRGHAQ